ncbi:MAG: HEAT repeat domain-containing protein [Anaerolineae bacterium]
MEDLSETAGDDLFYGGLIRSYVDAPLFVARPWLESLVLDAMDEPDCRFVLLTAEPGAGKTALMAWLGETHPNRPRYFIRRDSQTPLSSGDARSFLFTLGHQLAARRPRLFKPDRLEVVVRQRIGELRSGGKVTGIRVEDLQVSPFYRTTLQVEQQIKIVAGDLEGLSVRRMVAEERFLELGNLQNLALLDPAEVLLKEDPTARIVILVDALDELRYYRGQDSVLDWLASCPELPSNVRFVLSSRPDEALRDFKRRQRHCLREATIPSQSKEVRDDLSRYGKHFTVQKPVSAALARQEISSDAFVERAVDKAEGNFQYLAALFRGIEQALRSEDDEQLRHLLSVEDVPARLEALYAFFLGQMRRQVAGQVVEIRGDAPDTWHYMPAWEGLYQPILGVLSVAKEPPEVEQIRDFGHIRTEDRWLPGGVERLGQFMDREDGGYRLYHSTFPEFLTARETWDQRPDCYLDPDEWHRKIIAHILTAYGDDWTECNDPYSLSYIVQHVLDAELYEKLDEIFTDDFMNARLQRAGWHMPFVEDLERVETVIPPEQVVKFYLRVIHGHRPNSLVMQKVLRRLVQVRPRLGGKPIAGVRRDLDKIIDAAIAALDLSPEEAVPQLEQFFAGVKNSRVKGVIALALGETGSSHATPALLKILKTADFEVRWAAADALIALNDRTIIEPLIDWFDETDTVSDKQRVLYILGRMRAEEGRVLLQEGLDARDWRVKGRAVDLIWLLAPVEKGERILWEKLGFREDGEDGSPAWSSEWLQKRMVTALGRVGSPEAIPHLERFADEVARRPEPSSPSHQHRRRELEGSIRRAIGDLARRHGSSTG